MAHARLVVFGLLLAACSSDPGARRPDAPLDVNVKPARPPAFTTESAAWGKFHSKRFAITVPLPDGKAWKIDDHHTPDLVAVHDPTTSRITIRATTEEGLMNRQRCEVRARALGFVTEAMEKTFTTVEDDVWIGPEAYDSRLWVAIEAGRPGGGVTGHIFLFGSFIRRCLIVHLSTTVPSAKEEEVLATRLAVAEQRIVKALTLDAARTTDDATVPKEKAEIRR